MRVSLRAGACAGAGVAGRTVLAATAAKPASAPRRDRQQLQVNADRRLEWRSVAGMVARMTVSWRDVTSRLVVLFGRVNIRYG
jgi:hypothetical protein